MSSERSNSAGVKVCHVVATTQGGFWMHEQLRELRDQFGYDVYAVVSDEEGPLVDRLKNDDIPYFVSHFDFGTWRSILRLPRTIFALSKIFRRERFDIVQTHLFLSMIIGRIAAWVADVPVRFEMIASPFHLLAHTSRWIDRDTHWMETALIPSCKKTFDLLREMGIPDERLALIYYSADEKKFFDQPLEDSNIREEFGWPSETPVIANIAYFYPRLPDGRWIPPSLANRGVKGHEFMVDAMPYILQEFPDAKLLFVGKGWGKEGRDYKESIRDLVSEKNLEQNIVFTGHRNDVAKILKSADVAVQASVEENLGGTVEALMMGCPTVATRVGGMVDTVIDEETGLLAEPQSGEDLSRAIVKLLSDKSLAAELSKNGQRLMLERFSLSRTVADLDVLYQRHLENRRARGFNPVKRIYRMILSLPVISYIAFRLLVLDVFFPNYKPILKSYLWRLYSVFVIYPYHLLQRLVGKVYRLVKSTESGRRFLRFAKQKLYGEKLRQSQNPE